MPAVIGFGLDRWWGTSPGGTMPGRSWALSLHVPHASARARAAGHRADSRAPPEAAETWKQPGSQHGERTESTQSRSSCQDGTADRIGPETSLPVYRLESLLVNNHGWTLRKSPGPRRRPRHLEMPWCNSAVVRLEIRPPDDRGFQITRFMVMELIAPAALMIVILVPVVRHIARTPYQPRLVHEHVRGDAPFIRDDVARPAIGGHGADRFLAVSLDGFFLRAV